MANVTQSLFPALGDLLSPSLESVYAQQFQQASRPGDAMQAATGVITGAGARLNQGISGLFGQKPQAFAERDKLRAITAGLQQQGVDVTTPEGMLQLAQALDQFPEFTEGALRLRQQAAMMTQQRQQDQLKQRLTEAQIQTEGFQQTKLAAEAEAKLREPTAKKGTLAERLVELETKKAQQPLTAPEAAELVALEKVVKIQAPKGTDLTGLAAVFGKKASEEEAEELGKQLGAVEGKQQVVEGINSALGILKQGIYTGSYAEYQTTLAKKSLGVVGDLKRVENTEVFLNEVSSNVIPLLQAFGGSDSNEELKFLQRLVGGDITLEQRSIERILNNAVKKINRGIERTAAKGQAIREGKLPPLPQAAKTPAQTRTTKSGITYTVEE